MGNQEYNVNAAFNYWKRHSEEVQYICKRIPPPCPQRGDENYYVWRFNNFMERHRDCVHEPPVYYYGRLLETDRLQAKMILEAMEPESIPGMVKEYWLGLDKALREKQEEAKEYERNDKKWTPDLTESYGFKYCLAFGKLLRPKLTGKGQIWIDNSLDLLQEYMEAGVVKKKWKSKENPFFNSRYGLNDEDKMNKFYTNIELNDSRFRSFAFATHPDAYIHGGIVDLPVSDWLFIIITPELKEWRSYETWIQAIIVGLKILMNELEKVKNWIRDFF